MNRRILVTGGSGFIGTNVVEALLRGGAEVLSIDVQPPRNQTHQGLFRPVNSLDVEALKSAVARFGPEQVVHLAARTDLTGKDVEDYRANTDGTRNLIEAISAGGVQRCVFVSTKLVCRNDYAPRSFEEYCPDTVYGQSKVMSEKIVKESTKLSCPWCIARPTGIWGPWFGEPYRDFFLLIARGRYFHPGGTDTPKCFGYVGNVVYQIEKLLSASAQRVHGRTFYLSDYEPVILRDWADTISRQVRGRGVWTIPAGVVRLAALVGDALKACGMKNPPMTSFRLRNMRADTTGIPLDNLRELVGPLPYSLEDGVRETLVWLRSAGLLHQSI
jgi:nucleoside-diphosphate-sugar epimerase